MCYSESTAARPVRASYNSRNELWLDENDEVTDLEAPRCPDQAAFSYGA
jgi:hypothetical protein